MTAFPVERRQEIIEADARRVAQRRNPAELRSAREAADREIAAAGRSGHEAAKLRNQRILEAASGPATKLPPEASPVVAALDWRPDVHVGGSVGIG